MHFGCPLPRASERRDPGLFYAFTTDRPVAGPDPPRPVREATPAVKRPVAENSARADWSGQGSPGSDPLPLIQSRDLLSARPLGRPRVGEVTAPCLRLGCAPESEPTTGRRSLGPWPTSSRSCSVSSSSAARLFCRKSSASAASAVVSGPVGGRCPPGNLSSHARKRFMETRSAAGRRAGVRELVMPAACASGRAERIAVLDGDLRTLTAAARTASIPASGGISANRPPVVRRGSVACHRRWNGHAQPHWVVVESNAGAWPCSRIQFASAPSSRAREARRQASGLGRGSGHRASYRQSTRQCAGVLGGDLRARESPRGAASVRCSRLGPP